MRASSVHSSPKQNKKNNSARVRTDRPAQIRRGEGVVDDEGDACLLRDRGELLEGADLQGGVGHRLAEDASRLVVDRGLDRLGVAYVDELGRDAEIGQNVVELVWSRRRRRRNTIARQ